MDRTQEIRAYIDPAAQRGVEIGPLDRPVVSPTEGEVVYVDYFTAQELRQKHSKNPAVNCDLVVDVCQIVGNKTLSQTLGEADFFDYVVASHVIEHVPDLIGWLREVAAILKPQGILSLAIPDKRFTFDYLRTLSTPGDAIDAYHARQRRPSVRHVFDHFASAVHIDPAAAWRSRIDPAQLTHYHSVPVAWQLAVAAEEGEYIDAHVWIFTPELVPGTVERVCETQASRSERDPFRSNCTQHDRVLYHLAEAWIGHTTPARPRSRPSLLTPAPQ